MTLYEEYKNGLDVTLYCERAYSNLLKVIDILEEVELLDEIDKEVYWDALTTIGDMEWVTSEKAKKLIKETFLIHGDFIDAKLLSMVMDYSNLDREMFLNIYCGKQNNLINRKDSRMVKSVVAKFADFEILDCLTTKGIKRTDNEDFTVSITSPFNNNVKLLVVCDGVGGSINGKMASLIAAEMLIDWFNLWDFRSGSLKGVTSALNNVISKIRSSIKQNCCMGATTLTFAVIGEKATMIGNIGDSRAYIVRKDNIIQVTKDETEVWESCYNPGYLQKDELRFLKENNIITNAVDCFPETIPMQTYYFLNNDYDGLLLMSDGVTDILSDERIVQIFHGAEKSKFLEELLLAANYGESEYLKKDCDYILYPTLPGKDNASAAMYLKLKRY